MTTLICASNSDGIYGRCDAKCYDAKGPTCDCICGGKNHGAGKDRAMKNTAREWEPWIKAYAEAHGLPLESFKVFGKPAGDLFPPEMT